MFPIQESFRSVNQITRKEVGSWNVHFVDDSGFANIIF